MIKNRPHLLHSLLLPVTLTLLSVCGSMAQAQIAFTLDQPALTGTAGATLTFSGTLTNTGASTVFLNGDAFAPLPAGFTLDDTDFFLNTPLSLAGNASTSGALFTVHLDAALMDGDFAANTFQIIGGADNVAQNVIGSAAFTAQVGTVLSVPEPNAGLLSLAFAVFGTTFAGRMRRKKRAG